MFHFSAALDFELAANRLPEAADLLYRSECERLFRQWADLGEELPNIDP